jgi:hypothetical protein
LHHETTTTTQYKLIIHNNARILPYFWKKRRILQMIAIHHLILQLIPLEAISENIPTSQNPADFVQKRQTSRVLPAVVKDFCEKTPARPERT